jgi:hypothetical protein
MIFKLILFCCYLTLKAGLKIASLKNPSFKKRLKEKDLAILFTLKNGTVARLLKLNRGDLSYHRRNDEFINFTVVWNGWGSADTLRKKLHLNFFALLNTGMIHFKGDLSALSFLLVILGEMIKSFTKNQKTVLQRAEL